MILAAALILLGLACLVILTVIDLRTMLLPDPYVIAYGALGLAFHLTTHTLLPWPDMLLGAAIGGGFLALVRLAGNHYYGQESMGLGDVKLLIAGGLWLGPMGAVMAITLGAAVTLLSVGAQAAWMRIRTGQKMNLHRLEAPAGPGFCVALAGLTLYHYWQVF